MNTTIDAAARRLATGDPLGALQAVALREDAPALALRGIAMAQLGDLDRAKTALRAAARAFGTKDAAARARCVLADAELALVSRDLGRPVRLLAEARAVLEAQGDRLNAAHARNIEARRLLLIGALEEAERVLEGGAQGLLPPPLTTVRELVVAGIAIRRLRMAPARAALRRARRAARAAGIAALTAEVESACLVLDRPAARLVAQGAGRLLRLDEVAALLRTDKLVVDACRHVVRNAGTVVSLATRPILFTLARALGEAWPAELSRDALVARAFGGKQADESHRARLRVEIGRLRAELRPLATVRATKRGFALSPRGAREAVVLAPPVDEAHAEVLALLADGEAWSSADLALALGTGQRSVQRALAQLAGEAKVEPVGRGRARRWMAPSAPGFPTTLLLPGPLPIA